MSAVLIYDASCSLCTGLATKIRHHARTPVEIRALSDPRAAQLLAEFYPNGWEHDFYLVEEHACSKGARSLNKLRKYVGARLLAQLVGEYASAKVTAKRASLGGNGGVKGRALAAVEASIAGFPRVPGAFEQPSPDHVVNFAEGRVDHTGSIDVRAWTNTGKLRKIEHFTRSSEHAEGRVQRVDEHTLRDLVIPQIGPLVIDRAEIVKERVLNSGVERRSMVTLNAALEAPRYHIGIFVGHGDLETEDGVIQGATMAVGIRHDLAVPVADVVTLADGSSQPVRRHLDSYSASLGRLKDVHSAAEGRAGLVSLYEDIRQGFDRLVQEFADVVPGDYRPLKNRMLVSATPEILRFVEYPPSFSSVVPTGCDCSCSCGACCAVGCGVGACIPPKPCGPGCCISCGCGCGCCL
ncbi:MAG: hypothetical protein M0026_21585 [Nocardiopsaceae bacterium]|nr:hypothetical protein [Nocardiopsaceae bacterium]